MNSFFVVLLLFHILGCKLVELIQVDLIFFFKLIFFKFYLALNYKPLSFMKFSTFSVQGCLRFRLVMLTRVVLFFYIVFLYF